MFLTAEQDSPLTPFHLALGPSIGIFLFFRTAYRVKNGIAKLDGGAVDARSRLALIWGLLVTMTVLVITGLLLVWANQLPVQLLGFDIESPWVFTEQTRNTIATVHHTSSYLLLSTLVLHIVVSKASERMFSTSDQST